LGHLLTKNPTEQQWEWLRSQPFWFCPNLPLVQLPPKRRGTARNDDMPWFKAMMDSMEFFGLRNPVILNLSDPDHPMQTFSGHTPYSVRAGNNRIRAAPLLDWQGIPALVWGQKPKDKYFPLGPLTLDMANCYLKDGAMTIAWYGPALNGVPPPQEEFSV